ncbi:MAG TPA: hypothetical protein VFE85_06125 [Woeseiaceae bacterium]|nr:hypothetical protein [Woeseiaceae bacterium]
MNDELLTLYYYRDGLTEAERRDVAAALESDAALRAAYEQLCRDLAQLGTPQEVAVKADVVARWHDSIERAARLERQRLPSRGRLLHVPSFAWGTVLAAVLIAGIGIGFYVAGTRVPVLDGASVATGADSTLPASRTSSLAFVRGLKVHLSKSRRELAGLPDDAAAERAALIAQMIEQNRLFERAAAQNGSRDLARVLRAFEPILERLAADDVTPREAEVLQAQLAFELNVMLTKLGRGESEQAGPI